MHPRTHPVQITVSFASTDYRVFVSAARRLRRIMGRAAPDVLTLIQFNLHDRDATGLADDYLDAIRWPNSAGRVVTLRLRRKSRRSARTTPRTRPLADTAKTLSLRSSSTGDPSLN